jgi:predicted adenylyl cyclase CyaB
MKNLEIKYQISDLDIVKKKISKIDEVKRVWQHYQKDIYYNVPHGRLKLRIESDTPTQLIFYKRVDTNSARKSYYEIYQSADPDSLSHLLQKSFGIKIIVKKFRSLFLFRNVRIHLDIVEELGTFLELESVMNDGTNESVATKNLDKLLFYLKNIQLIPVSVSYSDILLRNKK